MSSIFNLESRDTQPWGEALLLIIPVTQTRVSEGMWVLRSQRGPVCKLTPTTKALHSNLHMKAPRLLDNRFSKDLPTHPTPTFCWQRINIYVKKVRSLAFIGF